MKDTENNKPRALRGFAAMDPKEQRAIASKGGRASGGKFTANSMRAREAGRKGGKARAESLENALEA